MKRLIILLVLAVTSIPAFAQFPLGSSKDEIKNYFANNISYASFQQYTTGSGTEALNFIKVRVVGDYTFYFDTNDRCSSYVVTYDIKELPELTTRFDQQFCRMDQTKWEDPDNTFNISMLPRRTGENFISVVYTPKTSGMLTSNVLASN